jgi:hypothetical protein
LFILFWDQIKIIGASTFNGVQKQSLTFIDNDTRTLTDVRLGAQGIETGTRGTIYFDDFESRRFSYIGTLTDPGVDDPQATNPAGWFTRTYQYSASIPHAVTSSPSQSIPEGANTTRKNGRGCVGVDLRLRAWWEEMISLRRLSKNPLSKSPLVTGSFVTSNS